MTLKERIADAIQGKQVLKFYYNGGKRVIEPYRLGVSKERKKLILIGYQTGGFSEKAQSPLWASFEVNRIRCLETAESFTSSPLVDASAIPKEMRMISIVCERNGYHSQPLDPFERTN
jgi:predicted DNA-binding transcriptional regulator YafY